MRFVQDVVFGGYVNCTLAGHTCKVVVMLLFLGTFVMGGIFGMIITVGGFITML
jgi:hypothetical protein